MNELKHDLEELVRPHGLGCGSVRVTAQFLDADIKRWKLEYFKVPAAKIGQVVYAHGSDDLDELLLGRIGRTFGYGSGTLVLEYQDHGGGPELHWLDLGRLAKVSFA